MKTIAKKMSTKEASVRIQKFVAKHFGKLIEVPKLTQFWAPITRYDIDPATLGPFGLAIETMTVEIKVAVHPETGEPGIILEYKYDHIHGGSNGYRVCKESI